MSWVKRGNENTIQDVFMKNMGVKNLDEVNDWFRKSYKAEYVINQLKAAVCFAMKFKTRKVKIIGDFDCDGVTATSILLLALKWAGFQDVTYRIPRRFSEGFGINETIIDEVESGLIITCDNGIAQLDAIKKAKEKGLSVIVIDHHMPVVKNGVTVLPPADFIINPHAIPGSADYDGYCGAGLSYRFACEMLNYNKQFCNKLLGIAAIGTVADVMELKEENYVIVRNGLKTMQSPATSTVGLYALTSSLGCKLTSKDIGFKIGPMLNAASRMNDDGAKDGVELLTYEGPHTQAVYMVTRLSEINKQRKVAKKEGLEIALNIIESEQLSSHCPMVVYVPDVKEGVVGIIAADIVEKYKVPAIILTDSEKEGILKGSSRSCGNYDMKAKLDEVSELLTNYGGHPGAAGLSLEAGNLIDLRKRLIENNKNFVNESSDTDFYDIEISADSIPEMIEELKRYEPFGEGNPMPVFMVKDFNTIQKYGAFYKIVGSDGVKFYSKYADAIGFELKERSDTLSSARELTLYGTLSDNYFNGNVTHQVEVLDFV